MRFASATIGWVALATAALAWGVAHAGGFTITAHGMSPGGGNSASASGCRRLSATFGEPVAGRASGGAFVVTAGFQAGNTAFGRDSIFNNGFQECT
ncbi:MAG: hypothetical protein J0L88_03550 [Xanthomonadales bacterium]|nr:hypothetical protein [Xanthomonadales bacterium]